MEFDRFEDGFLNVPIPNYCYMRYIDRKLREIMGKMWKNYILILAKLKKLKELKKFEYIPIPILVSKLLLYRINQKNFEYGKIIF